MAAFKTGYDGHSPDPRSVRGAVHTVGARQVRHAYRRSRTPAVVVHDGTTAAAFQACAPCLFAEKGILRRPPAAPAPFWSSRAHHVFPRTDGTPRSAAGDAETGPPFRHRLQEENARPSSGVYTRRGHSKRCIQRD